MARFPKKAPSPDKGDLDSFNVADNIDIGNFDLPEVDLSGLDFLGTPGTNGTPPQETRYILPRQTPVCEGYFLYDNAQKLARDLRLGFGQRADVLVNGSFIFGDFIEAYIVGNNAHCHKLTISTLSLNQNNIDSLATLLQKGYVDELNLIVSHYFWAYEVRSLIPYMYRELDQGDKFQLAVAFVHTKTAQFETDGGRKIVMHGSANLRSSGNIEQFTIEENPALYDFYDERFGLILQEYATIRKTKGRTDLWRELVKKKFNH